MLIDQRMIMAFMEEVRIKLGTLIKILGVCQNYMEIEAPLVLNLVSYICTPQNPKN